MYLLDKLIKQEDFESHVNNTLSEYSNTLKFIDLKKFNNNLIDPIKLLFDKNIYKKSYDEIILLEIHRQRDKTNTNSIGYFHQNIFKYIEKCEVPKSGWDVIFTKYDGSKIYIEMKNKHNTMNSSSSAKTYMKMQNLIFKRDEKKDICALVEIISKKSSNKTWDVTVDGEKLSDESIR